MKQMIKTRIGNCSTTKLVQVTRHFRNKRKQEKIISFSSLEAEENPLLVLSAVVVAENYYLLVRCVLGG